MASEANRWIITSHRFREHVTIDSAIAELKRIQGSVEHPERYRMVRIKRTTHNPDCSIYDSGPPRCNCPMGQHAEKKDGTPALEMGRAS